MVFQHFNLFPHLTVKKNLELAPSLLKLKDKEAISKRADELLARVGLADKANVYPKSLSGGQQQRIAIARRWRWTRTSSSSMSLPAPSTPRWWAKCWS